MGKPHERVWATQNRSECFNSLAWARAPKTEYISRPTIDIAVSHAVLVFNSGRQALTSVDNVVVAKHWIVVHFMCRPYCGYGGLNC